MDFAATVAERSAVKAYDPSHELTDDDLRALFALATRAPSSFNLQHWRYVVLRDAELRKQVRAAAWDQAQVTDAAVCVVVTANVAAWSDAGFAWADAPAEIRDRMVPMIAGFYQDQPQLQRDEAIRSGALGAMALMFAATSMGLDSCPMIGFDPVKVSELIGLDADHTPVMLLPIGKRAAKNPWTSTRLPLADVVKFNTLGGPGLAS